MWLERRLGGVGETRRRIIDDVSTLVMSGRGRCELVTAAEIDALVMRAPAHLDVLFPRRGEAERVRRIVSYGAMLGAIAAGAESSARNDVVVEAAMFNLGVALFDSVVDEHPASLPALNAAVQPHDIWHSLRTGSQIARVRQPWVNSIIECFETMALSVHRRHLACVDSLGRMLVDMHASEISVCDRFKAKVLPTRFIGLLADSSTQTRRLFESLAQFVALWDDWQDLADDMIHGRANLFLGDGRISRMARSALRLVAGRALHSGLRRRLVAAADRVLIDAQAAGRRAEVREFIAQLLPGT